MGGMFFKPAMGKEEVRGVLKRIQEARGGKRERRWTWIKGRIRTIMGSRKNPVFRWAVVSKIERRKGKCVECGESWEKQIEIGNEKTQKDRKR